MFVAGWFCDKCAIIILIHLFIRFDMEKYPRIKVSFVLTNDRNSQFNEMFGYFGCIERLEFCLQLEFALGSEVVDGEKKFIFLKDVMYSDVPEDQALFEKFDGELLETCFRDKQGNIYDLDTTNCRIDFTYNEDPRASDDELVSNVKVVTRGYAKSK